MMTFRLIQGNTHRFWHGDRLDCLMDCDSNPIVLLSTLLTMLTQLRRPVCLSLSSADSLFISEIETVATLYQKDCDRYHLVLTEPLVTEDKSLFPDLNVSSATSVPTPRLLWLEFSPYRVTLTMQGNGQYSFRHSFEPGVYGTSRFWLQDESLEPHTHMLLRNFTRILHMKGSPLPRFLVLEYELWAHHLKLGEYRMDLEIHH